MPGQTRDDEVGRLPGFAQNGDRPVAGGRHRAGAVDHPVEHGVEVQALVDPETGLAEESQALLQLPYPLVSLVPLVQLNTSRGWEPQFRVAGICAGRAIIPPIWNGDNKS